MKQQAKKMLMGSKKSDELFKEYWEDNGFEGVKVDGDSSVTSPIQEVINDSNKDMLQRYNKSVRKNMAKAMDSGEVENSTQLVFDPEIVSILKQEAPVLDFIPQEGQDGFDAVFNVVGQRDDPIGYTSESDVLDVSGTAGRDIGFTKDSVDMTIYFDLAEISDFTQAAASHYMNVAETTLGERVGLHAQKKAQQIFYGDNSLDTQAGGVGEANGFDGLSTIFNSAGNRIDKSGTSSDFIDDIRTELHKLKQAQPLMIGDLVIVTSYEFFEAMTRDLVADKTRFAPTETNADIGIQTFAINGVPVVADHNVDVVQNTETVSSVDQANDEIVVPNDYTSVLEADDEFDVGGTTYTVASTSYSSGDNETTITVDSLTTDESGETATIDVAGDKGDVFIMNQRTTRFRSLVPFSTVPLAKLGLAETTALFEFGALIEKSQGNFGLHLQAYNF